MHTDAFAADYSARNCSRFAHVYICTLQDNDIVVFFRNNHFNALYKRENLLLMVSLWCPGSFYHCQKKKA